MKIEYFKQDIKFLIFELVLWCNDTEHNDTVQNYDIQQTDIDHKNTHHNTQNEILLC